MPGSPPKLNEQRTLECGRRGQHPDVSPPARAPLDARVAGRLRPRRRNASSSRTVEPSLAFAQVALRVAAATSRSDLDRARARSPRSTRPQTAGTSGRGARWRSKDRTGLSCDLDADAGQPAAHFSQPQVLESRSSTGGSRPLAQRPRQERLPVGAVRKPASRIERQPFHLKVRVINQVPARRSVGGRLGLVFFFFFDRRCPTAAASRDHHRLRQVSPVASTKERGWGRQ